MASSHRSLSGAFRSPFLAARMPSASTMWALLGQEGGGGVVGNHGAGDVLPGQLVGQQGPGGEGGAAFAEGDLLQQFPLPAPAGDAQGPGGGGGGSRPGRSG